jgi:FlaA1/EpsC-like NDP-sugar epimerase
MERTLKKYRPDVVFHAAAYKHVPMLEWNPWQAVRNNIEGTHILMELSVACGVGRFILVSTDKAVRPANVMGAGKRCCERLMYAYMGGSTRMMAVRFGNVVGSAGSVIPLFQKQIAAGGPVTVTHPEVTRFFMTIPEASQLILQAGSLGTGGEIFILEMGTPVKIADMAKDLIRLSGKEPGRDIEIRFDKLRPGEKLYEELITEGEGIVSTAHEKIMMIQPAGCFDEYGDQTGYREWLFNQLTDLYAAAETYDPSLIRKKLQQIVTEYKF